MQGENLSFSALRLLYYTTREDGSILERGLHHNRFPFLLCLPLQFSDALSVGTAPGAKGKRERERGK